MIKYYYPTSTTHVKKEEKQRKKTQNTNPKIQPSHRSKKIQPRLEENLKKIQS